MLKLALPNGSLQKETLERLRQAGFAFDFTNRCYTSEVQNPFPVRATIMRPQHIPQLVWQGNYDAGICGWDWILESLHLPVFDPNILECMDFLWYKKVKIVLFGPSGGTERSIKDLKNDSKIFSEYPNITRDRIKEHGLKMRIVACYGTAEACVPHDFPYGVCVSETGSSLRANDLRVIEELLHSETMLLINPKRVAEMTCELGQLRSVFGVL